MRKILCLSLLSVVVFLACGGPFEPQTFTFQIVETSGKGEGMEIFAYRNGKNIGYDVVGKKTRSDPHTGKFMTGDDWLLPDVEEWFGAKFTFDQNESFDVYVDIPIYTRCDLSKWGLIKKDCSNYQKAYVLTWSSSEFDITTVGRFIVIICDARPEVRLVFPSEASEKGVQQVGPKLWALYFPPGSEWEIKPPETVFIFVGGKGHELSGKTQPNWTGRDWIVEIK